MLGSGALKVKKGRRQKDSHRDPGQQQLLQLSEVSLFMQDKHPSNKQGLGGR